MYARKLFLIGLIAGTTLTGCQHGTMSKEEYQQRTEEVGYNTVVFTDYDLNRQFSKGLPGPKDVIRVTTVNHGMDRTETGTAEVWVELRNHTDYHYVLEGRTSFYSPSGRPVDARPVWKLIQLPPNSTATYTERSVGTDPLQYRVEVRQAP